jgi:hypothetical protein
MSLEVKNLENILRVLMNRQLVLQMPKLEVISHFKFLIDSYKYRLQNSDILQLLEEDQDHIALQ